MSYKTILVHVTDERRIAGLIDAATALADPEGSHIICLYVVPPLPTYGATALGVGMIEAGLAAFRKEAERVHAAFEAAVRGRAVVPEWWLVDNRDRAVADVVVEHARVADLVVAGQRDRSWDFSSVLDVPERLVTECGRPVLVIPHAGRFPTLGKRVTIAWSGRREGARAAFDALPILQSADRVRILWLDPQADRRVAGDVPGAALATTLARHGVRCETATTVSGEIGVGDALLNNLSDSGADLLVMGAYGHSRLRELVLGGVTQYILDHMTVPVLMSH
jgi:nucleotide-binding universal stress UspA family protein